MSKAFTSEENEEEDYTETPALPPGVKNYMTPAGAERLRSEAASLEEARKQLSGNEMDKQNQSRQIDRRLRYLSSRIEVMEVIDPLQQPKDRVLFGATVKVQDTSGAMQTWRIVGLDETDLDRGWISWMSPLATALLDKRAGESALLGKNSLTIQSISYEE